MMRSRTIALPFVVERITKADVAADLYAVEELARGSFSDGGFSAVEEIARPWSRIWVARPEAETAAAAPIAFLVAWHVADELHVLNIATEPSMRRRGIARMLMDVALDYARDARIRIVLLEVRRSNRAAIKLYRGLGFTAMGVRPGYYADNDEDAIEMMLALDPNTGRILPGRDEIRIDG